MDENLMMSAQLENFIREEASSHRKTIIRLSFIEGEPFHLQHIGLFFTKYP